MLKIAVILAFASLPNVLCENYTPVVLWHGMGDTATGMSRLAEEIKEELPGVHVNSLKIGNNFIEETLNGFVMHPDKQIELACDIIQSDPLLANGYNAVGFSQGSQFLRALVQRCPTPKMKNLISIGGQQQGVYGFPFCDPATLNFCDILRRVISNIAYSSAVQDFLVQATYWHDSQNETAYLEKNSFLVDINNEIDINATYVENLQALETMVLVMFEDDNMVIPKESQWFGFYKPGQGKEVQTMQESSIYNKLGLDKLDGEGKIHFLSVPGRHLQFSSEWFLEDIIRVYLK